MADSTIPDRLDQETGARLLSLWTFYGEEAERCKSAGAWFAACVMLGARREATLLGCVLLFPEELRQSRRAIHLLGGMRPKLVQRWGLGDLLKVTKEVGWLPATFPALPPTWDGVQLGDWASLLQMARNFQHPANFLESGPDRDIGVQDHQALLNILNAVMDRLGDKIEELLNQLERSPNP